MAALLSRLACTGFTVTFQPMWVGTPNAANTGACAWRRLVGPALTVAKRLSQHAPWGGLLASKEAVREQGELAASWRFQEALRVDSGGLVDAYALQMRAVFGYARRTSPQRLAPGGARSVSLGAIVFFHVVGLKEDESGVLGGNGGFFCGLRMPVTSWR